MVRLEEHGGRNKCRSSGAEGGGGAGNCSLEGGAQLKQQESEAVRQTQVHHSLQVADLEHSTEREH